jgi:hypothetical protein
MVVPRGESLVDEHGGALRESVPSELYCPFPGDSNPRVEEAQAQSLEWALEQGLVAEGPELEKLERARLGMLEAHAFPDAPVEVLTLATVWVTLFCAIDDFVESSHLGPLKLSAYLSEVLSSFRGGSTGPDPLCRGFHDFGRKLRSLTDGPLAEQFGVELEELFSAYLWEEINRQNSTHPDYTGYRIMRVTTIGLRPHFLLSDAIGPDGRPSEKDALVLRELERIACLAVGWANDIFTYQKELSQGEGHNIVAVLMRTEELPMREALARSRALHDDEVCRFLRLQARLESSFGLNEFAEHRVRHLRNWIGGHLHWAINNGRYRPSPAAA